MILSKKHIPRILWFILLLASVPLLHMASRVASPHPLPEDWRLPDGIDGWEGEPLYYSTDPQVLRAFRAEEIPVPGICPVSGAPLDLISAAERRLLPADVEIRRRLYTHPDGRQRLVILLVTGASREGIHRPEWCLTAQGVQTGTLRYQTVSDAAGEPFGVAVYPMLEDRVSGRIARVFVYWFEGPGGVRTPYNWLRILRTGWDRLRQGRAQRWAYFSIQMSVPPGVSDPDAYVSQAVEWLVKNR